MKIAKISLAIFIAAIFTMNTSCTRRIMDFTIISSKNLELSKFPNYKRVDSRVEGEDKKMIIIFIPTGEPDGKEALDRAIESVPGAVALVDGVLTYKWFWIPYIYGEMYYVVEGTPLIDPSLANVYEINELDDYSICMLDKNGEVINSLKIEEDEYENIKAETCCAFRLS